LHGEELIFRALLAGQSVVFKIDYCDTTLAAGSPDPANAESTKCVITILLASEY
jgi:hypothetical protein